MGKKRRRSTDHEVDVARAAIMVVLDEMREHGTGETLFYAQRLATALNEPDVITQQVKDSGRLSDRR